MFVCYRHRLLPSKSQHRALDRILESQRQLYNAALEERIGAYRKAGLAITYFDQTRSLSEWRSSDREARELPVRLQRATLKRLDEAYQSFFCRVRQGGVPGFPRFRGKGWFDSFGFRDFTGITLERGRLGFRVERRHECPNCALSIDRDLNAARNVLNRAGVGPGLRNVAGCGMRAGKNLMSSRWACEESVTQDESLPNVG